MTGGKASDASLVGLLTGLGWSPDRQVDLEPVISVWTARGHAPSAAAVDFVNQFDGMTFEYPRHVAVGGSHECVLDAVRATGAANPSRVHDYERRVGQRLAPVGLAASNHVVLMVAPSGQVFGGYDDFLALYGEDGKAAIWRIFHQVSPVRLPMA
ncbi:SUKH-3 domain-containing protein [Micromonospora sp. KLBMP9576]|uniref:SUKH-3 domain-containing protein n=1 Tax=Micromonospora sp. KLBMP9576 TaxID=3424769 RepID=UPI003D946CAB